MSKSIRRIYMPSRNIISSLLPLTIVTWYFIDKIGGSSILLKVALVLTAFIIQSLFVFTSSKTRKNRRSFFWNIYNLLTGDGRLPLRLLASALVIITAFGVGFELTHGVVRKDGTPPTFITRFVEVDLYWSVLNFLGISDNSLEAYGYGRLLTVLVAISGLLFWGMYISVLINKHLDLQQLKPTASTEEIDLINFNEVADDSGTPIEPTSERID